MGKKYNFLIQYKEDEKVEEFAKMICFIHIFPYV